MIKYAPGDQVILLSKIDCQWYRVMVEEIRGNGEVVVTHGSRHPNETVPKHEIVDRLRQRTIHLEGLPTGWVGKYVIRLPDTSQAKEHPAGDLHITPPNGLQPIRSGPFSTLRLILNARSAKAAQGMHPDRESWILQPLNFKTQTLDPKP